MFGTFAVVDEPISITPESRMGITLTVSPGEHADDTELRWHQPAGGQLWDRHGRFAAAGLAVLVDSSLGAENHRRRPAGTWTVTTELRLDVLATVRPESTGLSVRALHVGEDGHAVITRGEIYDDDGRIIATGLVKSLEISGLSDSGEEFVEELWAPALHPGSIEDVLCLSTRTLVADFNPDGPPRSAELQIEPDPGLANPLGNLHGGVFAAAAETAGAAVFPHLREVSSSSLDVRYMRQIPMDAPIVLHAEALYEGRNWAVAQVRSLDARGRTCAYATVTVYGRSE